MFTFQYVVLTFISDYLQIYAKLNQNYRKLICKHGVYKDTV